MLLGLWLAIGALVASEPGVQAEEGRALRVTDDTARHLRYTSRAKREADVSLSHRCTMEHSTSSMLQRHSSRPPPTAGCQRHTRIRRWVRRGAPKDRVPGRLPL